MSPDDADQTSFGVGSFHFGIKKSPPFRYEAAEYFEEIKKALGSIPNINEINIFPDETFGRASQDIVEELPKLRSGLGFFPLSLHTKIEFKIYLPYRIQEDLLKIRKPDTCSENFFVSLRYGFASPVTIVEILNPTGIPSPSSAVSVVRGFLEREFEKPISNYIRFEFLGPSPFHANFFVIPKENVATCKADFLYEAECASASHGYETVTFHYNKSVFKNPHEAVAKIAQGTINEIALYYRIVQRHIVTMNQWTKIAGEFRGLIRLENMSGLRGLFHKFFGRTRLIGRTLIDIAYFRSMELRDNISMKARINTLPEKAIGNWFRPFLEKEIGRGEYYPTDEYANLISFFEQRRVKATEIFIVMLSAIVGGSIGAIVTILLSAK